MVLSTQDILLKHVCPGLGVGIAFIMFMSPLKSVLEVNKRKSLGELNALPFIAMTANCFAWIVYGYVTVDFYIYIGNLAGLMCGVFYTLTCYKFSKEQAQDALRNMFLGFALLFFLAGVAGMAARLDAAGVRTLWGAVCVFVLALYYIAPLSSVAKVVAQHDSSSLHWPLCCMLIINGLLWFAYGMAVKDWFVGLPNGIGAAFNVICLVLCFVFPAKSRSRLHGEINAAANWQVLRLQSARHPDTGAPTYSSPATAGGFFDVSQFRWRAGGGEGSFLSRFMDSFSSRRGLVPQQSSAELPSMPSLPGVPETGASGSAADSGGTDCNVQHLDLVVMPRDGNKQPAAAGERLEGLKGGSVVLDASARTGGADIVAGKGVQ